MSEVTLVSFHFFFRRQAHLCVLASNCDEPTYVKLVEALCAEHQINLIKVSGGALDTSLEQLSCLHYKLLVSAYRGLNL